MFKHLQLVLRIYDNFSKRFIKMFHHPEKGKFILLQFYIKR